MITINKEGKLKVTSKTPRIAGLNRKQRRHLVYRGKIHRLLIRILELRKDMVLAGIRKIPKLPKGRNKNVLSGHMSQLKQLGRCAVSSSGI